MDDKIEWGGIDIPSYRATGIILPCVLRRNNV